MTPAEQAREALEMIGEVLAKRPHKDDRMIAESGKRLCIYRDLLIEEAHADGAPARKRLDHINAILSVVAATHYPVGDIPWDELGKARDWLAELLAEHA